MSKLEEIKRAMESGIYRYVCLEGKTKYNNTPKDYNAKCEEILKLIEYYQTSPDFYGSYCVKFCKNKGGNEDKINLLIGTEKRQTMNEQGLNIPADFSTAINHPAIKLQAEITTLKIQNENLENEVNLLLEENERLNAEIEELTQKIKEQPTLAEAPEPDNFATAKSMFGELLSVGAPLLDKWFQIQQEKNQILRQQTRPAPIIPQSAPVPRKLAIEQKIENWINSKANDTELFNSLQAIYFNSDSIQKFGELLKDYNENLYYECKQAI